jgi:signal transduction histidine kinase
VADTRVLEDIVNDQLASATMMAGTAPRDVVDLSGVAAAVCDSAAAHAASLGVTILFASEKASRVEVIGSESALRRALTSLIDNALAHGHDGGTIDVRVRRRDGQVSATSPTTGSASIPRRPRRCSVASHMVRTTPERLGASLMASGWRWSARSPRRTRATSRSRRRQGGERHSP